MVVASHIQPDFIHLGLCHWHLFFFLFSPSKIRPFVWCNSATGPWLVQGPTFPPWGTFCMCTVITPSHCTEHSKAPECLGVWMSHLVQTPVSFTAWPFKSLPAGSSAFLVSLRVLRHKLHRKRDTLWVVSRNQDQDIQQAHRSTFFFFILESACAEHRTVSASGLLSQYKECSARAVQS